MARFLFLFMIVLLAGCGGQSPQELTAEGDKLRAEGNLRGAVVLYRNALDKDPNDLSARVGLAQAYLGSGSADQAEREFQKALLQNPSLTEIHLSLAAIHVDRQEPDKALAEIEKYHAHSAETAESLTLQGRAHGSSGRLAEAENLFNEAVGLDPGYAPAFLNLAKIHLQRGEHQRADARLREAVKLDNRLAEAYYLLASLESSRGNTSQALDLYRHLIAIDQSQLLAYYMTGILLLDLGELAEAEQHINQLQSRFPERPEGSRLKGMLLYRQGNYDEARIVLEQSTRAEQHPLTYLFLGLCHYSLERYELALNQFQGALDLNPDFDRARILVALTLLKQKRVGDAVVQAQRVVRNDPNNAYARNVLGSAYLAAGDPDRGMAELERATALDPTLVEAHLQRGAVRLSQGQIGAGEEDLIRAVHVAPELLNSRLMLVTHYLRQKNYSAAIETLQEGMNATPQDALLNNYLAAAYFSQNRPQQAIDALGAAKKADPSYLTPYFNLAAYHASQSDYERALAEYQSVLDQDADNVRALLSIAAVYNLQGRNTELDAVYRRVEGTGLEQGFIAVAQYRQRLSDSAQALAVVDRGLRIHPDSIALNEFKGALHQQRGEHQAAETALIRLARLAPEQGNVQLWRFYMGQADKAKAQQLTKTLLSTHATEEFPYQLDASLALSEGDPDRAVSILQQGIATVAAASRLRLQLGSIHEQRQQPLQAKQLYERILQDDPTFAPAYTALGSNAERAGNKGAARDYYQKALALDADNIVALNNLAYILADNFGEHRSALEYANRAYQLRPNDPRIMDTLGYILVGNDRPQDALNLLQQAHELLPDIPVVALHLAQAKIGVGDNAGARLLLEQVSRQSDPAAAATAAGLLKQL